jgi:hypothetical protein
MGRMKEIVNGMGNAHLIQWNAECVVRETLATVVKCHLDYRVAGNVACWLVGLETSWRFKAAMRFLVDP